MTITRIIYKIALVALAVTSDAQQPQLTALTINPKTVSVSAGDTVRFSAQATWSTGRTTLPPVTYSTTGGTVTSTGRYTAPATTGTYRVVVEHSGGTLRDTAVVTVQGEAAPPNQSGVTVLFRDGFETGDFSHRQGNVRWTSTPWVDVTSDIAHNGIRSARFRQGASKNWGELRFGGLPQVPEVFIQFHLYQPNGQESPFLGPRVRVPVDGMNDKFFRLWSGPYNNSHIKYGASTWGAGGVGRLGTEFMRNDGTRMQGMGQGGSAFALSPKPPFIGAEAYLGRWVSVRIRCRVSSPANNNGVIQIWLDDQLVADRQGLPSFSFDGIGNFFESGYLLGWANSGFQAGQHMYIDDVVISTGGFSTN
jgi:hypothetical protein